MKKILKKLFHQSVWDVLRYYKLIAFKRYRSEQKGIDRKLDKYLDYENGFYVELGAYDGFTNSNTFFLEKKKNWKGILIEPSLNNFLSCIFYRKKKNKLFCNACVSFEYNKKYVDFEYAEQNTLSTNIELDIKNIEEHLNYAKKNLSSICIDTPIKFGAVARTLNSILVESNCPKKIDFLSLDVEGAELNVLQGVNFNEYEFKYMLIECRDINKLSKFLIKYKYNLIDQFNESNFLFSKKINSTET
jgi:FkbM family methyltransferase